MGREQGRRQAERRAGPGDLLKLRQSRLGSGVPGRRAWGPRGDLANSGSAENQRDCGRGWPLGNGRVARLSTLVRTEWGGHLIYGDVAMIMINSTVKSHKSKA